MKRLSLLILCSSLLFGCSSYQKRGPASDVAGDKRIEEFKERVNQLAEKLKLPEVSTWESFNSCSKEECLNFLDLALDVYQIVLENPKKFPSEIRDILHQSIPRISLDSRDQLFNKYGDLTSTLSFRDDKAILFDRSQLFKVRRAEQLMQVLHAYIETENDQDDNYKQSSKLKKALPK